MNQYSMDWVNAKQTITPAKGLTVPVTAWSSSAVYRSSTRSSIASDETVRMAVMASDAIDALFEFFLETLWSNFISNRILSHPAPRRGGSPPNTTTKPSFQLWAMPRMLQATTFRTAIRIRPTLKPISSNTD